MTIYLIEMGLSIHKEQYVENRTTHTGENHSCDPSVTSSEKQYWRAGILEKKLTEGIIYEQEKSFMWSVWYGFRHTGELTRNHINATQKTNWEYNILYYIRYPYRKIWERISTRKSFMWSVWYGFRLGKYPTWILIII